MAQPKFDFQMVPFVDHGFFWITFSGEIGIGRLAKAHQAFTDHPDYRAGINELLDFSETSIEQITRQNIEMIRTYMRERTTRHHCRSAMVISSELEFGLGRMLGGMLSQEAPVDRGIFYSVAQALEWLYPGQSEELMHLHDQITSRSD